MPRFFVESVESDRVTVAGQDAAHIRRALRMRVGEEITLCDGNGTDAFGEIAAFGDDTVEVAVRERHPSVSEPTIAVTLYQGLPKGDKLEWIIQKAVELGVTTVVPVETARSVATMAGDAAKAAKKAARWQKIAEEAAGQSGRGRLPRVESPLTWKQALSRMAGERLIVLYEGGGQPLSALVSRETRQVSLLVGPEGGWAPEEIETLTQLGAQAATLGKRILRCETAPLAALAAVMTLTGNME